MARLGTVLIVLGLVALAYAGLWQLGVAPGSRVTLPPPVAMRATPEAIPTSTLAPATPQAIPTSTLTPATPEARATAEPIAARVAEPTSEPAASGYAVRLAIPAIKLETQVQQGGIVNDSSGNPIWETLPFVAVHYGDLTARIGEQGNAVIAGHVVTLNEGNVFRFLYQLDFDDTIEVWTEHDVRHAFRVIDVKLVPPTDLSVMAPTPDETLTLITCGGTFDPVRREFSERLIVTAKPVNW